MSHLLAWAKTPTDYLLYLNKIVPFLSCSQFLASLQLDQSKLSPEPDRLPQVLLEKCAAISVQPNAIKDLVDAMQRKSPRCHLFIKRSSQISGENKMGRFITKICKHKQKLKYLTETAVT
jgi:hypothetical protein